MGRMMITANVAIFNIKEKCNYFKTKLGIQINYIQFKILSGMRIKCYAMNRVSANQILKKPNNHKYLIHMTKNSEKKI